MNWTKIANFWLPPVLWAGVIFTFSSFTTIETTEIYWQDFILKKSAHLVEYAILAVLVYRALVNSGVSKKKAGFYAVAFALLYGTSDEFHQGFTPGREPRARDVVIDTIGATLAIYVAINFLPKAPKKVKAWAEKFNLI